MPDSYTPLEDIPKIHAAVRRGYLDGKAKTVAFRKQQLAQLGCLVTDNKERLHQALTADLGRHRLENDLFDFGPTAKEIRMAYDNIENWTAPQAAQFSLRYFAMGPRMKAEPKGTVLIVSAFNLPIFLTLGPLASAIASGCSVVLKPSEATPTVNKLWEELLPQYIDQDLYKVVFGSVSEMQKILELQWDHILYIGGERVARIIAEAAAKHLTPTTLELGGKNPVVVDPKADVNLVARRVLWGRFSNSGQICTCPEYILVPEEKHKALVDELKTVYNSFYPNGAESSDSFSRIVTKQHAVRIKRLIDNTKGTIVAGGQCNVDSRYVAPTIVDNVTAQDSLMSEEIFGPVLSVIAVKDVGDAIAFIRARPHPLCVYVFSPDKIFQERVFSNTESGAAVVNEVVMSPAVPHLPIGGIGRSGHGYYGSKYAFDQFTHWRVSIENPKWTDSIALAFRFPPYPMSYQKYIPFLYKSFPPRPKGFKPHRDIGGTRR